MKREDMLRINQEGWDKAAPRFAGVTALPIYGPLIDTEEQLGVLGDVGGERVLEVGCGDGHSLAYMARHGAGELWDLDLSPVQIQMASEHLASNQHTAHLFVAPMEHDICLPREYFDLVYSIYALGWTTDLPQTLSLVYAYLKPGGRFVFSWEHPVYSCLTAEDDRIIMDVSYSREESFVTDTWRGKAPIVMQRRKMSTYLNGLVEAGFIIEKVLEPDLADEHLSASMEPSNKWYSPHKASHMPTTIIVKARKPDVI